MTKQLVRKEVPDGTIVPVRCVYEKVSSSARTKVEAVHGKDVASATKTKSPTTKHSESLDQTIEPPKKKKVKSVHGRPMDHRYISKRAMQPCIEALEIVKGAMDKYVWIDESHESDNSLAQLEMVYPGTDAKESFLLCTPRKSGEYNPFIDLQATALAIVRYCIPEDGLAAFGDEHNGLLRSIIKYSNLKEVERLRSSIAQFNDALSQLKARGQFDLCEMEGPPASSELVSHILEQSYARTVGPLCDLLNRYPGFSNNVYGEVKHVLVQDFIRLSNLQPHHVFLDMGSGIGNVVLQVAAQCLCECYGIEIMDIPSRLARKQKSEFLSRMRYYARPCGKVTLKQGDFLDDSEIYGVITRADVIFVNNYAFDADLNQKILQLFLDLKERARIISLKSFVPTDRRTNQRNANSLESIFRVKEYVFPRDSVSWMNEGGKYYIHTVNRSHLQKA